MAIGVVEQNAFEQEAARLGINRALETTVNEAVVDLVRGRGKGTTEVPMALRQIIAEEKTAGAANAELAKLFDVSESSVSAYGAGATSTASYQDKKPELVEAIDAVNDRITGLAQKKILRALNSITEDKVDGLSVMKAAELAQRMSTVVKNSTRNGEGPGITNQIVVFRPRQREEDEFETIHVIEE